VIDYPDGRLTIRYNGVDLPYRTFDKRLQVNQAAIVENKRLGPILAYIAEQQKNYRKVATPFDQRAGVRLVLTLSSARVGKGGSNLRCDGW